MNNGHQTPLLVIKKRLSHVAWQHSIACLKEAYSVLKSYQWKVWENLTATKKKSTQSFRRTIKGHNQKHPDYANEFLLTLNLLETLQN